MPCPTLPCLLSDDGDFYQELRAMLGMPDGEDGGMGLGEAGAGGRRRKGKEVRGMGDAKAKETNAAC